MGERGGGVYKNFDSRANTRISQRVPRKGYVKGIPGSKIHTFEIGDPNAIYTHEVSLVAEKNVQIKHNALEAARVSANKALTIMATEFFMKVRVYPHHILRENAMATGAGADRFQEGMSRSFGSPLGFAARVKKGQKIMSIRVNEDGILNVKEAMRRAKMKYPVQTRLVIEPVAIRKVAAKSITAAKVKKPVVEE